MVRKTKEDALATRDSILDSAEQLFVTQGVAHTTLQHIATAAGLTRGANRDIEHGVHEWMCRR